MYIIYGIYSIINYNIYVYVGGGYITHVTSTYVVSQV